MEFISFIINHCYRKGYVKDPFLKIWREGLMTDPNDEPIKILGAGISGLSAAITLARNGYKIDVFEKNSHVGGRFKRDFQGLRNFGNENIEPIKEFEKFGVYIKPYKKLKRIVRYSRSHSFEIVSNNKPIYYLVLRGKNKNSIDSQLANLAVNYGANICYNTNLNISEADIVAIGPSRADSLAYGGIYYDVSIDNTGYVFLDKKYSPNGYFYLLPGEKKGEAEVINSTFGPTVNMHTLKTLYNKAIEENEILKELLDGATKKTVQAGIGCCTLLEKPYKHDKYYVGEAAGFQDVTAGFGIRYAVISGYLAAQSIIESKDYNEQVVKTFKSRLDFERKRSENFKKMSDDDLDKIFRSINEKFGYKLTLKEYEALRGDI
jgi:flavin-dependent dehydrogenase